MIRGLEFQIPNEYANALSYILKDIDFDMYSWHISEDEIFSYKKGKEMLKKTVYDGNNFKKQFKNKRYLPHFINLQAYQLGGARESIENYEDYVKSNCEIILLIWDSFYVNLYAKNHDIIELVKKNVEQNAENLEYITDENDCRTRMSVW
ncbi:MAG: DUF2691 family protein [Clostridia bacterium]|jgi:hypothetical protein|nr:DUF2691 family protein [Clostridia bacterium]MBT7121624.1 DUF2691 family protein [Clostridia bacterium]